MDFVLFRPTDAWARALLLIAGWGQVALVLVSLSVPRALRWGEETRRLSPLTRRVFWVYAAYIAGTNLALAVVTLAAPTALLSGSPLAAAVAGFAALWWGARLAVQFAAFDRARDPRFPIPRTAEALMVFAFAGLTLVYGAVALAAVRGVS